MRPLLELSSVVFSPTRVLRTHHASTSAGPSAAGHGLRRTAHAAPPATSTVATTTNGQTGTSSPAGAPATGGPGAPVPGTVSRNDQDPETTWPSADVTR